MDQKKTVLILAPRSRQKTDEICARFASRCELLLAETEQDLAAAICRAQAIIGEPDPAQLQSAQALSWLQITWAGADDYAALPALSQNVTLSNVSGAFGIVISEYVLGAVVAFYRAFARYANNQRAHRWEQSAAAKTIFAKRVLVLGMGDLGSNVARRMQAFGAYVTGVRRTQSAQIPQGFDEAYLTQQLDGLLAQADIVVNCLPSTRQTVGLMTRRRLLQMKKGALFVNVGRGSIVRNEDLVFALSSGHLGGAVLDVLENEPLEEDSPLWDMENVFLTPHIAGPSFGESADVQDAIWSICLDNLDRFLNDEPLRHVVDRKAGY